MAHNVGPVQVAMAGLYGLLGVKDGSNPDIITGFVQPVLDATPWWLRAVSVPKQEAFVIAFADDSYQPAELLASQSEWLYVHYAFVRSASSGAATDPRAKLLIYQPSPGVAIWDSGYVGHIDAAGANFATSQVRDIWIPPGFGLRGIITDGNVGDGVLMGWLVTRARV